MPNNRPRIRSKVVRSTINDHDILDLFHGILGTGDKTDFNLEIVYPKYRKILEHCDRFISLLKMLQDSPGLKHFPVEREHLEGYANTLQKEAAACFTAPDLSAHHPPTQLEKDVGCKLVEYAAVTRAEYDEFIMVYKSIKGSNLINTLVVTCKNLIDHKSSLENPDKLKDRFLTRTAGLSFAPLPGLPAMNFKQFYISDALTPNDKKFLLLVLSKMYTISHDVYDAITAPDVDVDEFVQIIMSSLSEVKKYIPRCDEAFDQIADSVHLLKGKFNGYYKDFIASNNPSIILENFVLDVSKESKKSTLGLTAQFRQIIGYYRKLSSQQQTMCPKLKNIFQHMDRNFQELARREVAAENDESSGSESQ